ncbi:MAG: DUF5654 family protein [Patescibacteria group bacterium]|nr:DUF5654 family protein [Patescibacteria group bacterium]
MPAEDKKPNETQEQFNLRVSIFKKTLELMTSAFALVAALAWNDAIQTTFVKLFGAQSGLWAKYFYAFAITGIVVWIGYKLSKLQKVLDKKENK